MAIVEHHWVIIITMMKCGQEKKSEAQGRGQSTKLEKNLISKDSSQDLLSTNLTKDEYVLLLNKMTD